MELQPCRPLALYLTDPSLSLSFALTNEPDTEHSRLPAGIEDPEVDASTLHRVAEALAGTDVSYM